MLNTGMTREQDDSRNFRLTLQQLRDLNYAEMSSWDISQDYQSALAFVLFRPVAITFVETQEESLWMTS